MNKVSEDIKKAIEYMSNTVDVCEINGTISVYRVGILIGRLKAIADNATELESALSSLSALHIYKNPSIITETIDKIVSIIEVPDDNDTSET